MDDFDNNSVWWRLVTSENQVAFFLRPRGNLQLTENICMRHSFYNPFTSLLIWHKTKRIMKQNELENQTDYKIWKASLWCCYSFFFSFSIRSDLITQACNKKASSYDHLFFCISRTTMWNVSFFILNVTECDSKEIWVLLLAGQSIRWRFSRWFVGIRNCSNNWKDILDKLHEVIREVVFEPRLIYHVI